MQGARKVTGLVLRKDGRVALLCANLTSENQRIRIVLPDTITHLFPRQMDAENLEEWLEISAANRANETRQPINVLDGIAEWTLPPFAYARFEWKEE